MRKSLKTMVFVVLFLGVTLLSGNHAYGQQTKVKLKGNTPTGALGQFLVQDDENQKYSELVVNLKDKKVTVNDIETTLQETLGVSKKREQILLNNTPKEFSDYIEGATECEVEKVSSDELIITNDFQTKRLIAMVDDLDENYGAINIVKGITAYILKYETDEATKEAYQKLVKKYGEDKIFYDEVFNCDNILSSEKNTEALDEEQALSVDKTNVKPASTVTYNNTKDQYIDTAKTMGLYDINKEINHSKYSDNVVNVAIIDTGFTATINSGCEIGEKLLKKNNPNCNYAFGKVENVGDDIGHGTEVSSLIAYNTPDNVKYCMFKVVDKQNSFSTAQIYAALEQAYMLDIDIVNCSFGQVFKLGTENGRYFDAILKKLYEKGTIVCCAAGNENNHYVKKDSNGEIIEEFDTSADCVFPANSDYVLCISALEVTKKGIFSKAGYSNTGNTVDYSAIGTKVYVYTSDSNESCASGTSFSTPLVAAEFAILKTCNDSFISVEQLREIYDLYLVEASKKADHKIYGSGYFDLSEYELCDIKHSRCCGLWHYDGTNADIGKKHTLTIDLIGGSGCGFYSSTDIGWKGKFTRTFQCGTPVLFASAYSMEADNPNGWIQFCGDERLAASGTKIDPYQPYRTGYQFVGWKCSAYGSVHKKIDYLGGKYTETWYYNGEDNENVTLTATWMPKKLYNILTINPNGGRMYKGTQETTNSFSIAYRNAHYKALNTEIAFYSDKAVGEPIREGYTFKDWKVIKGAGVVHKINGEVVDFSDELECSIDREYSLYAYINNKDFNETSASIIAEWIPNNYTVTLKTSSDTKVAWNTVTYDNTYGAMLNFVPTRIGYTFAGWYTEERGGEKITSSSKVKIAKDHDLYAHWTPNKYKVTIKTDKDTTVAWDTVTYGQKYSPMLNFIPKKTGYTFVGWYTELYGGEQVTSSSVVRITQDQILYAHWKNSQYKLTLRNEDKSIITTATVTYGKAYGGMLSYAPEREGYTFAGWYTAITGGTRVTAKTIVSTANDHDLYIRWTKKEGE